jgi:hypothetical protein
LKFDNTIRKFGFKANVEDNCVYAKFKNAKFIFLVLYVDDILLASNDVSLLMHLYIKDFGEVYFVLGLRFIMIEIEGVLGLSHKAYIDKILKRYGMTSAVYHLHPLSRAISMGNISVPRIRSSSSK